MDQKRDINMGTTGLIIISVFLMALLEGLEAAVQTTGSQLVADLLKDYNYQVIPIKDPSHQMEVKVGFTLGRVEALDERSQRLVSFGYLHLHWKDELLRWSPSQYGNMQFVTLHGTTIWLPEVFMFNSVMEEQDQALYSKLRARVQFDGAVTWTIPMKWSTNCPVDLSFFPFDTQVCTISVANWAYKSSAVNLTLWQDKVLIADNFFQESAEWKLKSHSVSRQDFVLNVAEPSITFMMGVVEAVPVVSMTLELEREPLFYLMNIILPAVIITVMSMFVYLLPPASGEKISFSITILLSYSVLLLMVSDIMPRTGSTIPYITAYIVLAMFLTSVSLMLTVIVLNMYHHHPYKPVPRCLRTLSFGCFARLLCVDVTGPEAKKIQREQNGNAGKRKKGSGGKVEPMNEGQTDSDVEEKAPARAAEEEGESQADIYHRNQVEWEQLARVTDRTLFLFGLLFSLALTVIFFMVISFTAVTFSTLGLDQFQG